MASSRFFGVFVSVGVLWPPCPPSVPHVVCCWLCSSCCIVSGVFDACKYMITWSVLSMSRWMSRLWLMSSSVLMCQWSFQLVLNLSCRCGKDVMSRWQNSVASCCVCMSHPFPTSHSSSGRVSSCSLGLLAASRHGQ